MQGEWVVSFNFNWSAVSGGAPYITLSTLGFAFNSVSIARIGNPQKIIIGFDEEQCVIGIKPYNNEFEIKSYDFANKIRNGWVRIGCRDFIKYLQSLTSVDFSKAKRYIAKYDIKENILMIFIKGESENDENDNGDE